VIGRWALDNFDRMIRQGRKPTGDTLSTDTPSWTFANMTRDKVAAIDLWAHTVPPVEPKK
jgi:hypothetical protein